MLSSEAHLDGRLYTSPLIGWDSWCKCDVKYLCFGGCSPCCCFSFFFLLSFLFFFVVVSSILSGVDDAILEEIALLPAMQLMSWSFVSVSRAGRFCRLWFGAAAAVLLPLINEHHMFLWQLASKSSDVIYNYTMTQSYNHLFSLVQRKHCFPAHFPPNCQAYIHMNHFNIPVMEMHNLLGFAENWWTYLRGYFWWNAYSDTNKYL